VVEERGVDHRPGQAPVPRGLRYRTAPFAPPRVPQWREAGESPAYSRGSAVSTR
jgi:hypothetical protein